jgi:hypothetical protein
MSAAALGYGAACPRTPGSHAAMKSMGTIALRAGKNGKKVWQAEQVCGGLFSPGPDPAELRAWVADDTELGKRVADDFVSTGRCPAGTLDQHFFAVQLRKFPDPDDAAKRSLGGIVAGAQHHGRGPVRAQHPAAGCDGTGGGQRRGSGAAAGIQHDHARVQARQRDQPVSDRAAPHCLGCVPGAGQGTPGSFGRHCGGHHSAASAVNGAAVLPCWQGVCRVTAAALST